MHFVVADDDADSRQLLQDLLTSEGHTVDVAVDGTQALAMITSSPPDMIISDILMPELDGFDLCRQVKEDPRLATIPFIFYTATYTQAEDERLALALGANRYLVKPTDPGTFLKAIDTVIASALTGHVPDRSPVDLEIMHRTSVARKLDEKNRELHSSEQRYRALVEQAPDAIMILDAQGRYIDINSASEQLTGYRRDELLTKSLTDLVSQESGAAFSIENLRQGKPVRAQVKLNRRDEAKIPVDFSGQQLQDGRILTTLRDTSIQKAVEARLRQAATVFDSTSEGIMITDSATRIIAVNRAFTEITGYSESRSLGKKAHLLASPPDSEKDTSELLLALETEGQWQGEVLDRRMDGRLYHAWVQINALTDAEQTASYVIVFADISQIKESQQTIDFLANYDALTGLPNRSLFSSNLRYCLKSNKRKKSRVGIFLLDLDRFKHINDSLGHAAGDQLIKQAAQRLQRVIREEDTLARVSGDEFIVLVEDLSSTKDAARVARTLLSCFEQVFILADTEVGITASLGIAIHPDDGADPEALIKNADSAMFQAKAEGGGCFHFYSSELSVAAFEHLTLETALRKAVTSDELELFYQPQIATLSGECIGAEALLHWRHPDLGLVSPLKFIPLAEETGLIIPIGEWVLTRACLQWQSWIQQGLVNGRISVNITSVQLERGGLESAVKSTLEASGLDPRRLELEITEGSILNQPERAIEILNGIRSLGARIAVDDFGTGYSSLSYLKRLPIDLLKIDQSFVRDIPHDRDDMAIASAVIALGHSLGLLVIAEGVETQEQIAFLSQKKCDELQGFYFSKPLPAEEFERFIRDFKASPPYLDPYSEPPATGG